MDGRAAATALPACAITHGWIRPVHHSHLVDARHRRQSLALRDLWLHQDLGGFDGSDKVRVPAHGAVLVKVGG